MRNEITREKQQMLFDLQKFSGVEKELGHPREQENSRILGCKLNSINLSIVNWHKCHFKALESA